MRKGDKVKLLLAQRLRREATTNLKWIALRLHMGGWTCVSNLLHEKRKHSICVNSDAGTSRRHAPARRHRQSCFATPSFGLPARRLVRRSDNEGGSSKSEGGKVWRN